MSGKPYYPNNWEAYKAAPDEAFVPHTFEELMSWKVAGWELPSSCLLYTSPSPRDRTRSRMPSSA